MCIRAYASIYMAGLLGLAFLGLPAQAEDPGAAPISTALKQQLLTDEKIAELCRASIANKYDMVEVEDEIGALRKVPRCVANYESMREVAKNYLNEEESARTQITAAISACGEDPNQASCLESAKALTDKAADLHDSLSRNAEAAVERLAGGNLKQ